VPLNFGHASCTVLFVTLPFCSRTADDRLRRNHSSNIIKSADEFNVRVRAKLINVFISRGARIGWKNVRTCDVEKTAAATTTTTTTTSPRRLFARNIIFTYATGNSEKNFEIIRPTSRTVFRAVGRNKTNEYVETRTNVCRRRGVRV